jgi:predicted NACHT family NTPase
LRLKCLHDISNLQHMVLVEGPPGSGKTTLLRMLAIDLLSRREKALYLPCYRIESNVRPMQLSKLLERYAIGGDSLNWSPSETHVLIDGLDEAPFDLSSLIATQHSEFKSVVVSARSAYVQKMEYRPLSLSIEPFTVEERDIFFEKWFCQRQDLLKTTMDIVAKYPDIGQHARLPLIATMLAALIESGFIPRTRAEIYDHRLELLLSRWDRSRGIARTFVDNPDAKRRFLRYLAFSMHSSLPRRRTIPQAELNDVFERALGRWGYSVEIEKVIDDLVVAHGLLLEESSLTYSFGHLTFQEHLAGEHIAKEFGIHDILKLLGKDWWREPLNFYASIKGNIDELVESSLKDEGYLAYARQFLEMASYAPYTSPGAIETLRDTVNHIERSKSDDYLK